MASRTSQEAMAQLAEHLNYLAAKLIKAAGALPDGEPWVNVAAVAMELNRLSRQLGEAARRDDRVEP